MLNYKNFNMNNNPFDVIEARLNNIECLLLDLKNIPEEQNKKINDSEAWFDLTELCEYIPDKPAKATVYTWVSNGLIPYHKGAKKLRFLKSEIDQWLKESHKNNAQSITTEVDEFLEKKKGLNK